MKQSLFSFAQKILKIELINGSLNIMIASNLSNAFAFFFNIFLTRKLTHADYGIYMSLISFIGLVTIPSQSITMLLVQYTTQFFSKKQTNKAARLYSISLRYLTFLSFIVFLLFLSFSKSFANFLHIQTLTFLWITGIVISLSFFSIVNNAFLQSLLKFNFMAWMGVAATLSRILVATVFLLLGFQVFGVLWGVLIGAVVQVCLSFYPLRFLFKSTYEKISLSKRDLLSYALSVSVIGFALTSFTSTDIILVKHYFNPTDAGLYSILSLIGRVIFYLTAPISTVLFPLIIKKFHQGSDFLKTFYLALSLVLLPSMLITGFYFLFPRFTLLIFLGGKSDAHLIPYVGLMGLYLSIFSLLNVTVTFSLSLKKIKIVYPLVVGAVAQIVAISLFHTNFFEVIFSSLLITSILLISFLLYYGKNYGSGKVQKTQVLLNNSTL